MVRSLKEYNCFFSHLFLLQCFWTYPLWLFLVNLINFHLNLTLWPFGPDYWFSIFYFSKPFFQFASSASVLEVFYSLPIRNLNAPPNFIRFFPFFTLCGFLQLTADFLHSSLEKVYQIIWMFCFYYLLHRCSLEIPLISISSFGCRWSWLSRAYLIFQMSSE